MERETLDALDGMLAQFQTLDWAAVSRQDPAWAQDIVARCVRTLQAREAVAAQLAAKAQAAEWERDAQARAAREAHDELARLTPGWTPETRREMAEFARSEFGFSDGEVKQVTDGRLLTLLHRAYAAHATAKKVARAKPGQATEPAVSLKSGGGAAISPTTGDFAAFERLADAKLGQQAKVVRVLTV